MPWTVASTTTRHRLLRIRPGASQDAGNCRLPPPGRRTAEEPLRAPARPAARHPKAKRPGPVPHRLHVVPAWPVRSRAIAACGFDMLAVCCCDRVSRSGFTHAVSRRAQRASNRLTQQGRLFTCAPGCVWPLWCGRVAPQQTQVYLHHYYPPTYMNRIAQLLILKPVGVRHNLTHLAVMGQRHSAHLRLTWRGGQLAGSQGGTKRHSTLQAGCLRFSPERQRSLGSGISRPTLPTARNAVVITNSAPALCNIPLASALFGESLRAAGGRMTHKGGRKRRALQG